MNIDIFNMDNFVTTNKLQEVTSNMILNQDNTLDQNGIFSTTIFGTMGSLDRKINFAYVSLKRKFFNPFVYMMLLGMFRDLPLVIKGEVYVKVDSNGLIKKSKSMEEGYTTGIDFFIDNWKKIRWNAEESKSRNKKQNLLDKIKFEEVFLDKWLIIPCYYRDINLHGVDGGRIEIDEMNGLYLRLMNSVNNPMVVTYTSSFNAHFTIQSIIVEIYQYLTKKLAKKTGLFRQALMGKAVDYAVINVISAPKFMSENYKNQMVPFNYIGVPLYLLCSMYYPFFVSYVDNLFKDYANTYQFNLRYGKDSNVYENTGKVAMAINTDNIAKIIKSYINDKSFKTRLATLTLNSDNAKEKTEIWDMFFDIKSRTVQLIGDRPFTLTDLLYNAAIDICANKYVLGSRYPIETSNSTIFSKVKILTTETTMGTKYNLPPDATLYEYPYLEYNDKGFSTSNIKWINTVVPNNSILAALGGDYDGGWRL